MTVLDLDHDKDLRHGRGLSMDMGSPYLLPPGLQSSRESIHSLSLTVHGGDDRYRPATTFIPNDNSSMRSYPESTKRGADDSSSYTSSSGRGDGHESMNRDLLRNAQKISRSVPHMQRNSGLSGHKIPQIQAPDSSYRGLPRKVTPSNSGLGGLTPSSAVAANDPRDSYISNGADMRKSHQYLGAFIHSREPSVDLLSRSPERAEPQELPTTAPSPLEQTEVPKPAPTTISTLPTHPTLPRLQSMEAPVHEVSDQNFFDDESDYGDTYNVTPPSPSRTSETLRVTTARRPLEAPMALPKEIESGGLDAPALGFDVRRLSMGFRPLPPEDPTDNPEQRANRIRSFYKEYFDESKPGPTRQAGYQEDYDQEYLALEPVFNPTTGKFTVPQAPYAHPMTRRAMTPPPRAPPRFQAPPRHQSTMSSGRVMPPGPRAFSSESSRCGPAGRGPQRKAMPPPAPLRVLPTPHLLQEDSFVLPIDFAPPTSYKDRQAGRPASPLGGMRPYSPMLPAHLPLASSFDDLSVMPSPHALRKSSTFTALDFAPPPRFKHSDTTSDAGSIRSNRSAMSAAQVHNIRSGAYRISRIPKEVVGTKTDIAASLKPTWDLRPQGS
ncbi:MAG: hypothetical protein M1830_005914 [Pleopsidium flavum]|nr:MAG: hypothetical protein M1830_005914 [Pleopsidium flavum]